MDNTQNKIKKFGKHGIIFTVGSFLNKAISIFLLPLYTQKLSASEYGILEIFTITQSIFIFIFSAGLDQAYMRFYYDDKEKAKLVFTTSFILVSINSIILLFTIHFLKNTFSVVLFDSKIYGYFFFLTGLISINEIIKKIPLMNIRIKEKSITYITLVSISLILTLLVIIYLVAFKEKNIEGVLLGRLFGGSILTILAIIFVIKDYCWQFSFSGAREMIKFGTPEILSGLCVFAFTFADRYMLKFMGTTDELGLYSLGYRFGMLMQFILIDPLKLFWGPTFLSQKNDKDSAIFYSKMLTYLFLIGCFVFLLVSILSKDIIFFMSAKEFWKAYKIVPIITLSYLFWSLRLIFEIGVIIQKKTYLKTVYFIVGAILNLVLNFLLIPVYGMYGAAYATLIAFIVMVIIDYFINKRLIVIKYEWGRISHISLITSVLFVILHFFVEIENLYVSLFFRFIVICTFPFILYFTRFFSLNEREIIDRKIKSVTRRWI